MTRAGVQTLANAGFEQLLNLTRCRWLLEHFNLGKKNKRSICLASNMETQGVHHERVYGYRGEVLQTPH